jgi:hypothetical protein
LEHSNRDVTPLGVSLDAILAERLPPARSKALFAQLIDGVRVVWGQDMWVPYRLRPEVRIPDGMVGDTGLAPARVTSWPMRILRRDNSLRAAGL